MKPFVILLLATVVVGETEDHIFYHRAVGIPLVARMKAAVEAGDAEGLTSRSYGGWHPSLGEYPYAAGILIYLEDDFMSMCGAALISQTRILTAAHCWYDGESVAVEFEVVLGSTSLMEGGTRIKTKFIQMHEKFTVFPYIVNDIALVTISHVNLTENIGIVNLPHDKYLIDDLVEFGIYILSYGYADDDEPNYHLGLQVIFRKIVSNEKCIRAFSISFPNSLLCTDSFPDKIDGLCTGDSGAPVILRLFEENLVVGIHSFGHLDGCKARKPKGHTRVGYFIDWIKAKM